MSSNEHEYYVSDSGDVVVGRECASGRSVLIDTAGDAMTELAPGSIDHGSWHLLHDPDVPWGAVVLPDGRTLAVSNSDPVSLELDGLSMRRTLDPGARSSQYLQGPPVVDPSGTWLVLSFYTTKVVHFGWVAWWALADVLAEDVEEVLDSEGDFIPNPDDHNRDDEPLWAGEPVKTIRFSADGTRAFMLDQWTIHAWAWFWDGTPELLWRVRRPEQRVRIVEPGEPPPSVDVMHRFTGDVVAVHKYGLTAVVRHGDELRLVAQNGLVLNRTARCGTPVAFAAADVPVSVCECSHAHGWDNETWWVLSRWDYSPGFVTALDADGDLALTGDAGGSVTLWTRNGYSAAWYASDLEQFSVVVSDRPIRRVVLYRDQRTIVAVDDAGLHTRLRWG